MATIRRFCCNDLLGFASVNLDHLTNTGEMSLYLTWFATWPDYSLVAVAPGNRIIGFILGTATEQSQGQHWQGLAMAVNVHSEYRRQGLATRLMQLFEKQLVEKVLLSPRDREYFMCLYIGANNTPARGLFEQLGYKVIRKMLDFDDLDLNNEDTFEMRKVLSKEEEDEIIFTDDQLRSLWEWCTANK